MKVLHFILIKICAGSNLIMLFFAHFRISLQAKACFFASVVFPQRPNCDHRTSWSCNSCVTSSKRRPMPPTCAKRSQLGFYGIVQHMFRCNRCPGRPGPPASPFAPSKRFFLLRAPNCGPEKSHETAKNLQMYKGFFQKITRSLGGISGCHVAMFDCGRVHVNHVMFTGFTVSSQPLKDSMCPSTCQKTPKKLRNNLRKTYPLVN